MGIFTIWESIKKIFEKKDNEKVEYDKIPFDSEGSDEMIDFKCKKCGYEEQVPDFVAFECYTLGMKGFPAKSGVVILSVFPCSIVSF